jgi:hypothetical protein
MVGRPSGLRAQLQEDEENSAQFAHLQDFLNSTTISVQWPEVILKHLDSLKLTSLCERLPLLMVAIDSLLELVDDSIALPQFACHIRESAVEIKELVSQKYFNKLKPDSFRFEMPPEPSFDALDLFVHHIATVMLFFQARVQISSQANRLVEESYFVETEDPNYQLLSKASDYEDLRQSLRELTLQLKDARAALSQRAAPPAITALGGLALQQDIVEMLDQLRADQAEKADHLFLINNLQNEQQASNARSMRASEQLQQLERDKQQLTEELSRTNLQLGNARSEKENLNTRLTNDLSNERKDKE